MAKEKKQKKEPEEPFVILSKEQLDDLLTKSNVNSIDVGGSVAVLSNTESLKVVEKTIDNLMKKHEKILTISRQDKIRSRGYIG